jgi:hypothetical protein
MADDPDRSHDIEIFKMIQAHYLQDLREFWVRNNMYLVINGALVSVYASTANRGSYSLAIAAFGLVITVFWIAVARSSNQWLRAWREELIRLDRTVDRFQVYSHVEQGAPRGIRSPASVTQWLPVSLGVGWVLIILLGAVL